MSERIGYSAVGEGEAAAFEDRVIGLLAAHAEGAGRPFDQQVIAIEAHGADGQALGGAVGSSVYAWAFLRLLAVAPAARGLGVGKGLIAAFEAEARRRGCVGVYLDTFSFQAPGFYARLGYEPFGRLPGMPEGGERIYFFKRLDTDTKEGADER